MPKHRAFRADKIGCALPDGGAGWVRAVADLSLRLTVASERIALKMYDNAKGAKYETIFGRSEMRLAHYVSPYLKFLPYTLRLSVCVYMCCGSFCCTFGTARVRTQATV